MKSNVMEDLLASNDIATILHTLTNPNEGFYALLESDELSKDMVKNIAVIIPRVLEYFGSPETLLQLLNKILHSKFLKQHVTAYCMKMLCEISEEQLGTYTIIVGNILSILRCLTQRLPSRTDELLPTLVLIEHTTKVLIDQDRIANNNLEEIQELLKQCSSRVEKRRSAQLLNQTFEQPPDDFRTLSVFPTAKDFFRIQKPFLRPNKEKGSYNDLNHYLDVQFRLMREDFLRPLINGIKSYKQSLSCNGESKKRNTDVRVYHSVKILYPVCGNDGPGYRIQFKSGRKIDWQYSKRLIFGSLVCLSSDDFIDSFVLATITNRNKILLNEGKIDISLSDRRSNQVIDITKRYVMAESTTFFEPYRPVLEGLQSITTLYPFEKYLVHAETNINSPGYLAKLENEEEHFDLRMLFQEQFDVALHNEPSHLSGSSPFYEFGSPSYVPSSPTYTPCSPLHYSTSPMLRPLSPSNSPTHPQYTADSLQVCSSPSSYRPDSSFDTEMHSRENLDLTSRGEIEPFRKVQLTKYETWPSKEELGLDESQLLALRTALTREIAVIQGPPGTGKTFVGLRIMKALLGNSSLISDRPVPILVVCYTNHALDQFLEGNLQFCDKTDILRVGGRSKSALLESCTLRLRRREEGFFVASVIEKNLRSTRYALKNAKGRLQNLIDKLLYSEKGIVDERQLIEFMSYEHVESLNRGEMRCQSMLKWLGVKSLINYRNTKILPCTKASGNTNTDKPEDNLLTHNERLDLDDQVENDEHEKKDIVAVEKVGLSLFLGDHINDKNKFFLNDRRILQHAQRNIKLDSWNQFEDDTDVWDLDNFQRWELYRFWRAEYKRKLEQDIQRGKEDYQDTANRFNELQREKDRLIMQNVKVIGMTTTGAAKFRNVLHEIGPRIVVVEEAAEVLESHIITTLSTSCEHLILIGDHQQLRPNPSVYELAEKYNLKISLFERLVNNGLPYVTLENQHRMRPEISKLLLNIYPCLKNHSSVAEYANVRGICKSYFFINHEEFEGADEELTSKSNKHEVDFLTALCQYLFNQGYSSDQITILTPYLGQVRLFRQNMVQERFEGVKIVAIDNYQGEENDVVLLSLVRSNLENKAGFVKDDNRLCVALSRAKQGLYVMGNFSMLEKESSLWAKMMETAKEAGCFGDALSLFCENHPQDDGVKVTTADDFNKVPEGGCLKPCQARLPCGHVCPRVCHNYDKEHEFVDCYKTCNRIICKHHNRRCTKKCSSKCETCNVIVCKELDDCKHMHAVKCNLSMDEIKCQGPCSRTLPCGHRCVNKCSEPCGVQCVVKKSKTLLCGHTVLVHCSNVGQKAICTNPCGATLKCGHPCTGTCGDCFNGRLHRQCTATCKRILLCGHQCQENCSEECPPCGAECDNRCKHSRCKRKCGLQCAPCIEKCTWQCRHTKCTRLCHEVCDRKRCDLPCRHLIRKCGHKCVGLCGETCICKECNGDITDIFFGTEDDPDAKFVKLEDCGHIFEVTSLDQWMDQVVGNDKNQNIQMKKCPKCNVVIRRSVRYGSVITQLLTDIDQAKSKILGVSNLVLENRKIELTKITNDNGFIILIKSANTQHQVQYLEVCIRITNRLKERKSKLENAYASLEQLHRDKIKDYPILNKENYQRKMLKKTTNDCEKIINWAMRKRNRLSTQEIEEAQDEINRIDNFVELGLLLIRMAKLKMTLPNDLNQELGRLSRRVLFIGRVRTFYNLELVLKLL